MVAETTSIGNSLVVRDSVLTWRWYDAFGRNVVKYVTNFESLSVDDTTGDPTEFVMTVVETGSGNSTSTGNV